LLLPDPDDPRLTQPVTGIDQEGRAVEATIVHERPLTLFLNGQEIVTVMTIGDHPEYRALGYLLTPTMLRPDDEVTAVAHDEELEVVVVRTARATDYEAKMRRRVRTSGCAQGTVFGDLMGELDSIRLPAVSEPAARLSQGALYRLLDAVRKQESTYKSAGSVHGCALFRQGELLTFVEDVGRHNAIDTIAGWMWLHDLGGADKIFYTTGRLTSEMVIKSAQMGVPIVVSRSGITQMGLELAERLGLALFGRATNRHFICYCGFDRFDAEPEPPRPV
jgi:FdhD protein